MKTEQLHHRPYSLHGHVLHPLNDDPAGCEKAKHRRLWELPTSHPRTELHRITVKLT
jgi:hypothetical protein